jgi:predicted N-acetyltransferase YhbS
MALSGGSGIFVRAPDMAVRPSHQGCGLGKEIITNWVAGRRRTARSFCMPCFYEGFGFRRMTTAMAIFENPARAHACAYLDRA